MNMNQITDEKLEEYQTAFDLFDQNRDGAITMDELRTVMQNLGFRPTEGELKEMIKECDIDENGSIEFNEFIVLLKRMNDQGDPRDHYMAAFRTFDQDGSGKISAEELRQVMHNLGERLTDDQIEEMIREADTDGDGQINYDEFVNMMCGK